MKKSGAGNGATTTTSWRDVGHHGFAVAAQVGTGQQGSPRQDLDDQHFVVRAIRLAAHAIAAHDAQLAARGARAQLLAAGVAHQQVPAEGRDHVCFEGFGIAG